MSGERGSGSGTGHVCRRVTVSGRVQGVGYRMSCAERATELGVSGWVRNLPDGDVEFVAEGDPEAVDALVSWSRRGPSFSRVTGVSVAEETPAGGRPGFEVRQY